MLRLAILIHHYHHHFVFFVAWSDVILSLNYITFLTTRLKLFWRLFAFAKQPKLSMLFYALLVIVKTLSLLRFEFSSLYTGDLRLFKVFCVFSLDSNINVALFPFSY